MQFELMHLPQPEKILDTLCNETPQCPRLTDEAPLDIPNVGQISIPEPCLTHFYVAGLRVNRGPLWSTA